MRRADDAPAAGDRPQAVIDVVVIQRKALVEAADGAEHVRAGHQTGARDGADVAGNEEAVEIAGVVAAVGVERVSRPAAQHGDAGVLESAAGEEQLRPDRADFRLLRELQHPLQPIRRNDLHVVVEKQQMLSPCQQPPRFIARAQLNGVA